MVALRSWDQHVWDPRPVPHETEAEIRPITVRPRLRSRPKKWSRDNVGLETTLVDHDGLKTLTSLTIACNTITITSVALENTQSLYCNSQ